MSRRIEGNELEEIKFAIDSAVDQATQSGCHRDHRGVVVFKDNQILGIASNGPIPPFECAIDKCGDTCGIYAMHAERLAIIEALEKQQDLNGASVLHVRIGEDNKIQISGPLRCEDCTGYMVRIGRNKKGMNLKEFILLQGDGWTAYDIHEADKITRKNLGLSY